MTKTSFLKILDRCLNNSHFGYNFSIQPDLCHVASCPNGFSCFVFNLMRFTGLSCVDFNSRDKAFLLLLLLALLLVFLATFFFFLSPRLFKDHSFVIKLVYISRLLWWYCLLRSRLVRAYI